MATTKKNSLLPNWLVLWFWITSIICIWDASFVIFRPHTLPGGKYHWFFRPYALYIEVDYKYKDMDDTFGIAQSLLNYVEVIHNFVVIYLNSVKNKNTHLLAFMVCVMTWWKTVLYVLQYFPLCDKGVFFAQTPLLKAIFLFFIPNGTWILLPSCAIVSLWKHLTPSDTSKKRQ